MKRIIFAICTILCANVLFAQEQLATLKHNDSISVYYGQNAFVEAYNAAANGDIITLSDGRFNATNISKEITLRGNGAQPDSVRGTQGTYFLSQIQIRNLQDTASFEAEGIFFQNFDVYCSYDIKLTNCCVQNISAGGCGLQARNCIIQSGSTYSGSNTHPHNFTNCVLGSVNSGGYILLPSYSILTNCIVKGSNYGSNSNSSLFNSCIIILAGNSYTNRGDYNNMGGTCNNSILCGWNNLPGTTNVAMEVSDVFETWDGNTCSFDPNTYKLKENVANSVLGNDGTQVGIFGGDFPFSFTPSYSVIKRLDVPNRTDENGMLNIDVEFLTE